MALKGYGTPTEIAIINGWDYNDSGLMAEVAVALEMVEEEIDHYCGTTFQNQTGLSRFYSGNNTNILSLGYYLRTLTSVWFLNLDGSRNIQYPDIVPQPDSPLDGCYRWLARRSMIDLGYPYIMYFPDGLHNLEVVGDWGFVTCPISVKRAAALSVKHFFDLRNMDATKTEEFGINRSVKNVSEKSLHYLHPVAMKLLDKWKNNRIMSE